MRIASNSGFIVTHGRSFRIYSKTTLELLKEVEESCYIFNLHHSAIFFCSGESLYGYNLNTGEKIKILSSKLKVTSLFSKDSYLYVGFESGLLSVYTFNAHVFRHAKDYKHGGPIMSLASDNVRTYVADYRNRITVYPDNKTFDFVSPRLFFKKYIFCTSENSVYARTEDAFGLMFSVTDTIEDLVFSEEGGLLFIRTGKGVSCYDMLGNEKSSLSSEDFTVISRNRECQAVVDREGKLCTEEIHICDAPMPEVVFKRVDIKEKAIEGREFDEKHAFVDDGNTKYLARNRREERKRPCIGEKAGNIREEDSQVEMLLERPAVMETPLQRFNPSAFDQQHVRLLFFSREGFMMSLESEQANRVSIHYHDSTIEPIEVEDQMKARLGSFHSNRFVLSNGKTLNFSNIWSKDIPTGLLGINDRHVYVFFENMLTAIDFSGAVAAEFYVPEFHSFCCSNHSIAVFTKDNIMVIQNDRAEYIPARNVEFGCFYLEELYVKIKGCLFKLKNGLLIKECMADGVPLTINGNTLVTLLEPFTLLPRPMVGYSQIRRSIEDLE